MTNQPIKGGGNKSKKNKEVEGLFNSLDGLQALTDIIENKEENKAELYCIMLVMGIIAEEIDAVSTNEGS